VDAGYYPRQVGERGTRSKNDRREQRKRKAVRTPQAMEGREKTIRDVEVIETQISDLRSQLNHTTQIIVAQDNEL